MSSEVMTMSEENSEPETDHELALATQLFEILNDTAEAEVLAALRDRLRILGRNAGDEVLQFRELQKACRDSPRLAAAYLQASLGAIAEMDTLRVTPDVGRLIQAFNRAIETYWEVEERPRFRKVVYTKADLEER